METVSAPETALTDQPERRGTIYGAKISEEKWRGEERKKAMEKFSGPWTALVGNEHREQNMCGPS